LGGKFSALGQTKNWKFSFFNVKLTNFFNFSFYKFGGKLGKFSKQLKRKKKKKHIECQ
jgi:hypothetical protein